MPRPKDHPLPEKHKQAIRDGQLDKFAAQREEYARIILDDIEAGRFQQRIERAAIVGNAPLRTVVDLIHMFPVRGEERTR